MLRRAHIIRGEMFVTCLKILYVPINIRRRKNNLGLHLDQRLHIPGLDHGQSILQSSRCHVRLLLSRRCTFLVSFEISTIFCLTERHVSQLPSFLSIDRDGGNPGSLCPASNRSKTPTGSHVSSLCRNPGINSGRHPDHGRDTFHLLHCIIFHGWIST